MIAYLLALKLFLMGESHEILQLRFFRDIFYPLS
jgi:hypothetical protein